MNSAWNLILPFAKQVLAFAGIFDSLAPLRSDFWILWTLHPQYPHRRRWNERLNPEHGHLLRLRCRGLVVCQLRGIFLPRHANRPVGDIKRHGHASLACPAERLSRDAASEVGIHQSVVVEMHVRPPARAVPVPDPATSKTSETG